MSVRSRVKSPVRQSSKLEIKAADLLCKSHPLHAAIVRFCGNNPPTKRQARKFLRKYPQFCAPRVG